MTKKDSADLEAYDPSNEYYYIGSGVGGGAVYRVVPPTGHPYMLKQFKYMYSRTGDVGLLRLLKRLRAYNGVEIITPELFGDFSMTYSDIRGQSLERVLNSDKLSSSDRSSLIGRWNGFLKDLDPLLSSFPGEFYVFNNLWSVQTIEGELHMDGDKFNLWLKPDNAIVEAGTGRIFISDPY